MQNLVPLHSRAVSYHSAGGHDVTITMCCVLVWICAILSYCALKLFCEWNTCYALVARWLYLARRKKKDEIRLIRSTRFLSIVFHLVNIRGVVQHKWLMVLICAMVQDFAFGERSTFYSTWLRLESFTSCEISYHCTINH